MILRALLALIIPSLLAPVFRARAADETPAAIIPPVSAPTPPIDDPGDTSFLRMGERIVFRLGWGIVGNAGQTTIETLPAETPGGPVRVRVLTESRGIVKSLYPLENDSVCYIDPLTGRPQKIVISGQEGKRETNSTTVFDYEQGKVIHTDNVRTHRSGTSDLPEGHVYDIMVTMLKLRDAELKVGDTRRVTIAWDDDIYDLELRVIEEDRVSSPEGKVDALVIEPKQLGELKGFFAKGGTMKFWISQGAHKQIVRMEFRPKIGTVRSVLIEEGKVAADENSRP